MYCMLQAATALALSNSNSESTTPASSTTPVTRPPIMAAQIAIATARPGTAPSHGASSSAASGWTRPRGRLNKTATFPSSSSTMLTASQPRAPSSLITCTATEVCGEFVGA
jgi:hypothetical protein